MMIGMSTRWIACHASWPMPGQPKTLSTTTMPDMNRPMSMPIIAITGSIALGIACRNRTLARPAPVARAVRMKSWRITSISEERIMREYQPAPRKPSVTEGRTRWAKVP